MQKAVQPTPAIPKRHSWTVDESRFPLVVTTFGASFRDDDDVRAMTAAADALFAKNVPFLHLIDLRTLVTPANAAQRKVLSDWYRKVKATNANARVVATAVIVDSAIVRGAMTAVLWVTTPAGERMEAFGKLEDATRWLKTVGEENGIALPKLP